MPQFDFYSYPVQAIWTLVGFAYIYFLVGYSFIPRFGEVIQIRLLFKNFSQKKSSNLTKTRYDRVLKSILDSNK